VDQKWNKQVTNTWLILASKFQSDLIQTGLVNNSVINYD